MTGTGTTCGLDGPRPRTGQCTGLRTGPRTGPRLRSEPREGTPVEAWEVMRRIKTALGYGDMQRLLGVGRGQVDRYCRNPEVTEDSERCPLRRLRALFAEAANAGAAEEVRAGVNMLAEVLGCRLTPIDAPEPDRDDVQAECLDDYPALVALHHAVQQREPLAVVRARADEVRGEVAQTVEMYARAEAGVKEDGER